MPVSPYIVSQEEKEDEIVEKAFQDLLKSYLDSNHRKKAELVEKAFRFAKEAHKGTRRNSGEPYILHPLAVAKIVISELGLGSTSICAALLHDVIEDTGYTREDIEASFGKKIADIVEGLTKISGGIFGDKASLQAENFRKLLLSMSTDIRVVLIKMADRLHNMRTLGSMRPEKQYKIAGETLYVYAPLAHRLGLYKIKSELENLAFKYEHPHKYEEIMAKLTETETHREQIVEEFVKPVREKLDAAGFKYEIKARVKSAYSIFNKMETKNVPFEEIYAVYAVRVIFENDDDELEKIKCWQIYTFFTDGHVVHPDRLRDWISIPKANGYRALHLTAMGPEGKWIEVQIRSRKMDEIAELGYAAHWKYKSHEEGGESELDTWMNTIKDILAHPEPNAIDFLDTIKLNLFSSEIYVFTPKGDLVVLPSGATVLDMAFAIHSELGTHCMAGKVNHRLAPLSHPLESGDQVEIITAETQSPQAEWLDYCKTAKAKNRLRAILRKDRRQLIERGEKLFHSLLEKEGITQTKGILAKIIADKNIKKPADFFALVGSGELEITESEIREANQNRRSIVKKLLRNPFSGKKKNPADKEKKVDRSKVYVLYPDEIEPNYKIDSCCNPIPGDDVLGFVDDNENVILHKVNCPDAMRLKSAFGSRLVATEWGSEASAFIAKVMLEGIDRHGMVRDIAEILSEKMDINIRGMNIVATGEVFNCELTVQIDKVETVDMICESLKHVKGIKTAKRI